MLKIVAGAVLVMLLIAIPSVAEAQTAIGDGGAIDFEGNDSGGTKPPSGGSGGGGNWTGDGGSSWVDPYAGLSCYERFVQTNWMQKTCPWEDDGTCSQTWGPVAGPLINLCPEETRPGAAAPVDEAAQRIAAQEYALNYLRTVALPVPQPKMSAVEGITGAKHQLNLQIENGMTFAEAGTPFGDLTMTATGKFVVDWGDGTKDTYSSAGAAYPNSPIKHSYANRGHYAINVTANWTAAWTFGAYSGTLNGLQTQGQIADFPVGDVQAVIVG